MIRAWTLLLAMLVLVLAGCGKNDDDASSKPKAPGPVAKQRGACEEAEQPAPGREGQEKRPASKLDPAKRHEVTLVTSCGEITVRLDPRASPNAAASFASLSRKGFFDGTVFHRIIPGFVVQGGDPTGSGSGGPGYSTVDKPSRDTTYPKGTVAMAKAGDEPPGTAGSQFYIVTGDAVQLPPDYAVLGKVTKGLDAALEIEKLGDPASGQTGTPLRTVVIEKARVSSR